MTISIYISTNSVRGFPFFHTLSSTCYLWIFRWCPFWLENFEHYFSSVWDECSCVVVWASFAIGMKTDIFQSYGHCWVFKICWYVECSTFTALSFRIWNSSTGIPSLPLALFVVKLSKAHLILHSRMSDARWVITPSWLSGSWRSFFV